MASSASRLHHSGSITAVLGPTNTGKTHYAIERMLSYSSGMMGFPLRLLAREVYDRVVGIKGKNQVGLITGEERIMPEGARYILATVEAMPRHMPVDFIAIDEVQMAADPDRGHVFTQHMLATRGRFETLLLGAATMKPLIRKLIPEAEISERPRYSTLSYVRPAKLHRLPRRSAVVAFSASDVYAIAELIRRDKGGAAIVMGALSPRTRNAQVAMYQAGEVDYLIATDAIGMGLNLDLDHIAFASLSKFDGRQFRPLSAGEAAQIAGRAGRFKKDGSFSTLSGGMEPMEEGLIDAIENHRFDPIKVAMWRNTRLDFSSVKRLIRSLEQHTQIDGLSRQRDTVDLDFLKALASDSEILARADHKAAVETLWSVCQTPDFRQLGGNDHISLLKRLYMDLTGERGTIDNDLMARQVKRLDNTHGDIDTLAAKIASIRVWTYVSHRTGWLEQQAHWASESRRVEDRLSDALHEKLTQRFVDRRTAVLMRGLKQRGGLSVQIDKTSGRVTAEEHEIGTLAGFSFQVDKDTSPEEVKTLEQAASEGLREEINRRSKLFANVGFKTVELDVSKGLDAPRLTWEGHPIAKLRKGGAPFKLEVALLEPNLLHADEAELVTRKAQEWLDARIAEKLEPILNLSAELNGDSETPEGAVPLSGLARGIAFRLIEQYGTLDRADVGQELRQLDQEARKGLRRFGVRFGSTSLYMPLILKPHATELRLILWALNNDINALPPIPTPGMVWVTREATAPDTFYTMAGFRLTGERDGGKAVRMDMVERLADAVRPLGGDGNWFPVTPEIMGLVGLSGDDFANVMVSLGYRFETRQESKSALQAEAAAQAAAKTEETPEENAPEKNAPEAAEETPEETADTPAEEAATSAPSTETAEDAEKDASDLLAEAAVNSVEPAPAEQENTEPSASEGETPASDDATASAADTTDSSAGTDAPEEDEMVDRLYFQWNARARRKKVAENGDTRRQGRGRGGQKPGDNRDRGGRGKGQRKGAGEGRGQGGGGRGKPRREKEPDPDSPFAALAGLKESLKKK